MTRLRAALSVLMALVIVVTAQELAVARGQPHAAGQIELCTGEGVLMVALDAQGNPVGPAHICPDAAMLLMAAWAPSAPDPARPVHISRAGYLIAETRGGLDIHITAQARGPPGSL